VSTRPPGASRSTLATADRGAVAELGDALRDAGLAGENLRRALGVGGELLARKGDIAVHERRLAGVEPLGPIVRLFVLERLVPVAEAARALAPVGLERLAEMGLVESDGTDVTPLVRIVPHDEILIASDRRLREDEEAPDYVAGVHGPSLTLSHLTVRRPVEAALDVGTGSGVQAVIASRHSGHVLATDINERALEFAAFNAALNGAANIELRAGSFFEPAAGGRFDLVTSNPPYVMSPESAFLFRDSGMDGDSVSRHVVEAAPAHIAEGGFATILVSWAHAPGEDWSPPLRAWIEGRGCDAWLLHHGTDDPLTHTANWNRNHFADDPAAFDEVLDRWLGYFRRLGIEGIAYGAVILRRRSEGPNWVRTDELAGDRLRPAGGQILRVFEAADYLAAATDTQVLDDAFSLAEASRLEQRVVLEDGDWARAEATLELEEGLGFHATLDAGTAELLASLDGRRPLRAVVDALAARQEVDRDALARDALGAVRGMLGAGFLVRGRR
jgi:methylase of polypeptide subunit release factors